MALSDVEVEAIHFKEFGYVATGLGQFARAVEAEVRKQDDVLIRQMLGALWLNCSEQTDSIASRAIDAARARLEEETQHREIPVERKSPATQDSTKAMQPTKETLHAKIWKLLDELEEVRSAGPGEGDWRKLNAADDDLRKTLEAYED